MAEEKATNGPINTKVPVLDASKFTRFYLVGDVHGRDGQLTKLLQGVSLVSNDDKTDWIADKALLIFTGDLIDGGKDSLKVWKLAMKLQKQAADKNSQVVIVRGNHEARRCVDWGPIVDKTSKKIKHSKDDKETKKLEKKLEQYKKWANEDPKPFGDEWNEIQEQMRKLPPCVALGSILFAHSGYLNTGQHLQKYWDKLHKAVKSGDHRALNNANKVGSITCTHKWVPRRKDSGFDLYRENIKRIHDSGYKTLVAGHECKLFGDEFDTANAIMVTSDFSFLKLDVGMKPKGIQNYPDDLKDKQKKWTEGGAPGTIVCCDISVAKEPSKLIDTAFCTTFSTDKRCPNTLPDSHNGRVLLVEWPAKKNSPIAPKAPDSKDTPPLHAAVYAPTPASASEAPEYDPDEDDEGDDSDGDADDDK